jgi:putative FmdB family regulatory protein
LPLYEYQCTKCHKRTEKIEKVDGPHLKKCPHCGGKVESVITAPAIQFKGAGWYVTDYAGKKTSSNESKSAEKEAPRETAKDSSTKDSKDSKDSKDTKASDPKASKK